MKSLSECGHRHAHRQAPGAWGIEGERKVSWVTNQKVIDDGSSAWGLAFWANTYDLDRSAAVLRETLL